MKAAYAYVTALIGCYRTMRIAGTLGAMPSLACQSPKGNVFLCAFAGCSVRATRIRKLRELVLRDEKWATGVAWGSLARNEAYRPE